MGFFSRTKKPTGGEDSEAATTRASAPSSSVPTQPPRARDPFDRLITAARQGEAGAMSRLWEAIYRLPKWTFVRRNGNDPLSTTFNPFCGVVDGQPSLFAFTDAERATRFGVRQKLGEPGGFSVLELERDEAIRQVLRLGSSGVARVIFNDEPPSGIFAPLTNLVFMYSHVLGVPLAEAATKFEQDPAELLHERVSQTRQDGHVRELLAWAVAQPSWWMLASESGQPLVWKTVEGEVTTAVFTSRERMERAGQRMKLVPEFAPVPSLQLSVHKAVGCVDELVRQHGLQAVALNLRLPIRADQLRALTESPGA